MKNWITPNTIILLVWLVALIHLHACIDITKPQLKNNKALSKTAGMKTKLIALHAVFLWNYNTSDYSVFPNNMQPANVENCMSVPNSCNDWAKHNPTIKTEKI